MKESYKKLHETAADKSAVRSHDAKKRPLKVTGTSAVFADKEGSLKAWHPQTTTYSYVGFF